MQTPAAAAAGTCTNSTCSEPMQHTGLEVFIIKHSWMHGPAAAAAAAAAGTCTYSTCSEPRRKTKLEYVTLTKHA